MLGAAREVPIIILMRCGLCNSKNDTLLRFTYLHLSPPPTLNRSASPSCTKFPIVCEEIAWAAVWGLFGGCLPSLIACLLYIRRERDRNVRKLDIILGNSLKII